MTADEAHSEDTVSGHGPRCAQEHLRARVQRLLLSLAAGFGAGVCFDEGSPGSSPLFDVRLLCLRWRPWPWPDGATCGRRRQSRRDAHPGLAPSSGACVHCGQGALPGAQGRRPEARDPVHRQPCSPGPAAVLPEPSRALRGPPSLLGLLGRSAWRDCSRPVRESGVTHTSRSLWTWGPSGGVCEGRVLGSRCSL